MKKGKTIWQILIIISLLAAGLNSVPARAADPALSETILQAMSAEEKIGQLFLVTYEGTDVGEETQIYNLITEHHIGGVVLLAENNNFPSEDILLHTQAMTQSLQQIRWDSSTRDINGDFGSSSGDPAYIPLFIGLKQLGNGLPGDQLLTGMTPLPSQMAIGASWDLGFANQVGEVLGAELSTLGINLFMGPNLDVIETSNSEGAKALGVNTYGGDPFWVGEMGKAFISGLNIGSNDRMMVVAQNFPGTANADRSLEYEVATVRKSLEQLKQIELAPFFAVTKPEIGDPSRVDAVLLSHIRYQGFQGNIRATTRPISFDSTAFQQIMSLPEFASWREAGGLVISDNLGSEAVRRFFDPNDSNFEPTQIARNAFLAGNDMLYIDDLIATGDPDYYTTLLSTLDFFVQKYQEDAAFAKRVDSSVLRVLSAKLDLYGEFTFRGVLLSQNNIDTIGSSTAVTFDVAQNAVTLISPTTQELDTLLPSPPSRADDIVIITDVRSVTQCDVCPSIDGVDSQALADALISLYGPQAGGQIQQFRLASFTFSQLIDVLENVENETIENFSGSLRSADWVIFNTLDINPNYPESNALQRILAERPDLLSGKNVIVFAMDSPIYLDATNISRITAYYALYSKAPSFLDVAARVLMQELVPSGALPVSLNAVGYDLISMTAPDPNQIIGLELVFSENEVDETPIDEDQNGETQEETPAVTQTPEPTPLPSFTIGDTITVRTDQIYDHNQNIVPDGTIVRFNFRILGDPGINQQFETTTRDGVAFFNYRIEAAGGLEIRATSEPAVQSETLQINISSDGRTSVFSISPTPIFSPTPTITPTETPTEVPLPTATPEPVRNSYPTLGEWSLGVIIMGVGGGLTYLIGYLWWGSTRWALRSSLCALIGGLLMYSYLNLGFSGTQFWVIESGTVFVVEIVVVGLLFGWIGALIWWMRTEGKYPSRSRQ